MVVTASVFRLGRSLAPRLPHAAVLIKAEYERAMLAARYYDSLKCRSRAEPRRPRVEPDSISRAIFEAFYNE